MRPVAAGCGSPFNRGLTGRTMRVFAAGQALGRICHRCGECQSGFRLPVTGSREQRREVSSKPADTPRVKLSASFSSSEFQQEQTLFEFKRILIITIARCQLVGFFSRRVVTLRDTYTFPAAWWRKGTCLL